MIALKPDGTFLPCSFEGKNNIYDVRNKGFVNAVMDYLEKCWVKGSKLLSIKIKLAKWINMIIKAKIYGFVLKIIIYYVWDNFYYFCKLSKN